MKRAILDTYTGPWTPGIDVSATPGETTCAC